MKIPVAVKLSPFFSSLAHFARRLDEAGADGLVLFNRFYQPDIDVEELEVVPRLQLSDSAELLLRLRWLAILSGHGQGVARRHRRRPHARSTPSRRSWPAPTPCRWSRRCCSTAPSTSRRCVDGVAQWLEEHEYESLAQARADEPRRSPRTRGAFERANYMKVLQSWRSSR